MARQWLRGAWLISVAACMLWGVLTVMDLSLAEARMGGFAGSRGGFGGGGFRGGFTAFHGGFGHHFHGGFGHGFHHHFRRNVFFFNVGFGGFWPIYPVAYPYPAYYPYYYPYSYSPCGYYDAYGTWVNAPCPPYAPPVSAPQQWSPPAGVSTSPAQPGEGGQGTQSPGY